MNLETPDAVPVPAADAAAAAGTPASDDIAAFRNAVLDKLTYMVGKDAGHAQEHDWLVATSLATRDRIVDQASRAVEILKVTGRDLRDVAKHTYERVIKMTEEEVPEVKRAKRKAKRAVRKTTARVRKAAA